MLLMHLLKILKGKEERTVGNVCELVDPPIWSGLKFLEEGLIDIRFFTDIHGPQRRNPTDINDALTCPSAPAL